MNLNADIDLSRGRIILPGYMFPAPKMRVLERADIAEIVDWSPPAILTTDGEFLFVSRLEIDALLTFARQQDIPVTRRYNTWADLLDPFLDTEFSEECQEATRQRLRERGHLTDGEIDSIRKTVEAKMIALTSVTWEWQGYGLYDVLGAMKPFSPFRRDRWLQFYADAMEIAGRNRAKSVR